MDDQYIKEYKYGSESLFVVTINSNHWFLLQDVSECCGMNVNTLPVFMRNNKEEYSEYLSHLNKSNFNKVLGTSQRLVISNLGLILYFSTLNIGMFSNPKKIEEFIVWMDSTFGSGIMAKRREFNCSKLLNKIADVLGYKPNIQDIISPEDYDRVFEHRWHVDYKKDKNRYHIITYINESKVYLSRFVMGATSGDYVDHINHNLFDNRRNNLRICTNSQNCMNRIRYLGKRSKYKGVHYRDERNRWVASIRGESRIFESKSSKYEIEAALIYDEMATKYFKEYAYLNFPEYR